MSLQLRSEASVLNKMRLLPPSDNTSAQFAQLLAGALALIQWRRRRSWRSTTSRASAALSASTRSHGRGFAKGLSARVSCDEPSVFLVSVLNSSQTPPDQRRVRRVLTCRAPARKYRVLIKLEASRDVKVRTGGGCARRSHENAFQIRNRFGVGACGRLLCSLAAEPRRCRQAQMA